VLLDPSWFPVNLGWRLGFGIGAVVGLGVIFLRHWVPESPRWLLTHGHREEAERVAWSAPGVTKVEDRIIVAP